MSSRQVEPALPAGWRHLRNRKTALLGMVIGIIGGITLLATKYDSIADQISTGDTLTDIGPAKREPIEGSELLRLILTPRAAERIDLQTAPVREAEVARKRAAPALVSPASLTDPGSLIPASAVASGTRQKVVPYSALLYDNHGKTWVYTCPGPLTFVRHQVAVDYIEGDEVVLSDGPAAGTSVVTLGAAGLYGTEIALGH